MSTTSGAELGLGRQGNADEAVSWGEGRPRLVELSWRRAVRLEHAVDKLENAVAGGLLPDYRRRRSSS